MRNPANLEFTMFTRRPVAWGQWVEGPSEPVVDHLHITWVYGAVLGYKGGVHMKRLAPDLYETCLFTRAAVLEEQPDLYSRVEAWIERQAESWGLIKAALGEETSIAEDGDVFTSHGVDRWFFPGKRNSKLHNLILKYLQGKYRTRTFSDVLHQELVFEDNLLQGEESAILSELSDVANRFSEYPEDHENYPNVYFTEAQVRQAAQKAWEALRALR